MPGFFDDPLKSIGGLFEGTPNPKGGKDYFGGLFNYNPPEGGGFSDLGLIGATLKDVANGGETNNIGSYQKGAQAKKQEAIRNNISGRLSEIGLGRGMQSAPGPQGGAGNDDEMRGLLMKYVAAGGDPKSFMDVMKFGPEYSTTPQFTQDGRAYVMSKDGQPKFIDGVTPREKMDIAPSGVAYNPYEVQPGTVFADPNKPFSLDQNGAPTANLPYQSYEINKARAGASNTNINTKMESAFAKTIGEERGKRYAGLIEGADKAQNELNMLGALEASLAKAPYRGPLANVLTDAAMLGGQLGLNMTDTAQAEAARAMSNQFALMLRNPGGGAGMPGAMSDKDREFLVKSVPGLMNSPSGGQQLVNMMRKMAQRRIEVGQMADEYVQKRGVIDSGFNKQVQEWAKANPLFGGQQQATSSAAPIRVQSQSDYDRVQPGSQYVAPDGTMRIKR